VSSDQQPTLFDVPLPPRRKRHKTASTSVDALDNARQAGELERVEREVLGALRAYGQLTRHQVADVINRPLSSVCGRANALIKAGHVHEVIENGRKLVIDGRHVLEAVIQQTQRRAG
jgi:putative intracellular protease/amidase